MRPAVVVCTVVPRTVDCTRNALAMPMSWPSSSTTGPPELPWVIVASVLMYASPDPGDGTPWTAPWDTVRAPPPTSGKPSTHRRWPGTKRASGRRVNAGQAEAWAGVHGRPSRSTSHLMSARSISGHSFDARRVPAHTSSGGCRRRAARDHEHRVGSPLAVDQEVMVGEDRAVAADDRPRAAADRAELAVDDVGHDHHDRAIERGLDRGRHLGLEPRGGRDQGHPVSDATRSVGSMWRPAARRARPGRTASPRTAARDRRWPARWRGRSAARRPCPGAKA
jgi:hypothetical protein